MRLQQYDEQLLRVLVHVHGLLAPLADDAPHSPAARCCASIVRMARALALADLRKSEPLTDKQHTAVVAAAASTAEKRALIWTRERCALFYQ